MKANIWIMWILAAFFLASSALYTVWNLLTFHMAVEWTGSVGLALAGLLAAFIAFYLSLVNRGQGGVLPEDRDADIDEGDPELGHFSPWSWWPILLAGSIGLVFMGMGISVFMIPIGIALAVIMLVGWTYEYYRGNFSR